MCFKNCPTKSLAPYLVLHAAILTDRFSKEDFATILSDPEIPWYLVVSNDTIPDQAKLFLEILIEFIHTYITDIYTDILGYNSVENSVPMFDQTFT